MIQEINQWLNSKRDYQQGLKLYEKYGTSHSLKRILRVGGETRNNLDSMVYELSKLVRYEPVKKKKRKTKQVIYYEKILSYKEIYEKYKGKIIYGTPGIGKSMYSDGKNIIDGDTILKEILFEKGLIDNKGPIDHLGLLAYRFDEKYKIYETLKERLMNLREKGKIILTGYLSIINICNICVIQNNITTIAPNLINRSENPISEKEIFRILNRQREALFNRKVYALKPGMLITDFFSNPESYVFTKFKSIGNPDDFEINEIADIKKKRDELYKQSFQLHYSLESLNEEKRMEAAFQILDNFDRITELSETINYFNEHNRLPQKVKSDKENIPVDDKLIMMQRLINLRTYISKYTRLRDIATTGKKRQSHQEKLDAFIIEKKQIEQKLNS